MVSPRFQTLCALLVLAAGCGDTPGPLPADAVGDGPPAGDGQSTGDGKAGDVESADSPSLDDTEVLVDVPPTGVTDAGGPEDEPEFVPEPSDEIAFIYDQDALRSFELVLTPENMAKLDSDPVAEEYVPGTLIYDGVEYPNVGVRYKGSAGAWINCVEGSTPGNLFNFTGERTCPKLSLKVSFNKYDPEGRFFGVKKLLFHAMNNDPSLMRERLGYWLFRQMGVAAPRAVHARVTLNGERVGLYANVEYIDGRFTRSRFEDGKGNLYKEVWPTWNEMTGQLTADRLLAGLRTNEDEDPSVQKVLDFSGSMQGNSETRAESLASWMRVPYVARFIAVDRTIGADDGPAHYYCGQGGCSNHNFYMYEEADDDVLWLIPWDLDNAFVVLDDTFKTPGDHFLKVVHPWNDLTVPCQAHPGSAEWTPWQMPAVCDPLWGTYAEHYGEAYASALQELLSGPFSPQVVEERLATWSAQIEDAVNEVSLLDSEQLTAGAWAFGLEDLKARVIALRDLASPEP